MPGFAEKLNIQNCENSSGYCVHYICTKCLDFQEIEYSELWKFSGKLWTLCTKFLDYQKNWIFRAGKIQRKTVYVIYLRNVWISKKIECPKLNKLNRKLCPLYVRKVWICRKIQYPELRKFNGKLCTLFIYGMSGLAKKSNLQNCVNSTGNCVQYMYGVSRCVGNLNI